MSYIIYDSQIPDFLAELAKEYQVFTPVEKDMVSFSGQYAFKEHEKGDKLALLYASTVLPPKEFLFPPKETIFKYSNNKAESKKVRPQAIFGLSYHDLLGVDRLTKVFESPVSDEAYGKKRESTLVMAVDRFSPPHDVPYDMYLQEVESGVFAAFAGSKEGKRLLTSGGFKKHQLKVPNVLQKVDPLLTDPDLPSAIKWSKNHKIWKELAKTCLGCGICSYVCPLCYCFETTDEIDFCKNGEGKRCRSWDSCLLKGFAQTSAHNFRDDLEERIYNWYFHKFARMPKEYGFSGCVDCNRCVIYCPSRINYQKVLKTVLDDYKKGHKK